MENEEKYGNYKIKNKALPPPLPYKNDEQDDLLHWCLKRDIAWALTSAIGHKYSSMDDLTSIGSWTKCQTKKALLEYLPVVPLPPTDNICKWYLDTIQEMIKELDSECIFLHADEAVYSKVMMIKWIEEGKYDKVILC